MQEIVIIGARGYGRECADMLFTYPAYGKDFTIKGFLDDKTDALDGFTGYPPIISSVEDYQVKKNDRFMCALGAVVAKKKYIGIIDAKGGQFGTFIHPTSLVFRSASIARGCIIGPFSKISSNVVVNEFTSVQSYANFGHDAKVGTFCSIGASIFLGGFSQVGHEVTLYTKATVLPHKKVGDRATVGAGSVVIRNVKPGTTVFGNPAIEIEF